MGTMTGVFCYLKREGAKGWEAKNKCQRLIRPWDVGKFGEGCGVGEGFEAR